jgi:hypothetical protein
MLTSVRTISPLGKSQPGRLVILLLDSGSIPLTKHILQIRPTHEAEDKEILRPHTLASVCHSPSLRVSGDRYSRLLGNILVFYHHTR